MLSKQLAARGKHTWITVQMGGEQCDGTIWSSCISRAFIRLIHPTTAPSTASRFWDKVHLGDELTFSFAAVHGGLDLYPPFQGPCRKTWWPRSLSSLQGRAGKHGCLDLYPPFQGRASCKHMIQHLQRHQIWWGNSVHRFRKNVWYVHSYPAIFPYTSIVLSLMRRLQHVKRH